MLNNFCKKFKKSLASTVFVGGQPVTPKELWEPHQNLQFIYEQIKQSVSKGGVISIDMIDKDFYVTDHRNSHNTFSIKPSLFGAFVSIESLAKQEKK